MDIQGSKDYGFISMLLFVGMYIPGKFRSEVRFHNEMIVATRLEF